MQHGEVRESSMENSMRKNMEKNAFNRLRESCIIECKEAISKSVGKDDLIIQVISHIEEMEKITNQIITRLREWYGLYNPEFSRSIKSNLRFSEIIAEKSKIDLLKEIGISNIKQTMGADLAEKDIKPIMGLANLANALFKEQEEQKIYAEELLRSHCPNATEVLGVNLAGKLVRHSGSLRKLALSASTAIQIMGAEKALFKHIKTGSKCPKYGLIFAHPLISKVRRKDQGKMAREIADKASIAFKIDFFKGEFIGKKLRQEIEERAKKLSMSSM